MGAAGSLDAVGPQAVIGFDTTFSATALTTAGGQYLAVPPVPLIDDVPNVIQFEFVPTNEMPAGRYYLTVNTQFVNDAGRRVTTALQPGDIEFPTKSVAGAAGRLTVAGPATFSAPGLLSISSSITRVKGAPDPDAHFHG